MQNKSAGKSTRAMERRWRFRAKILLISILVMALFILALVVKSSILGIGGSAVLVIALTLYIVAQKVEARADKYIRSAEYAEKGAKAEEEVEAILAGMNETDYFPLHDISCPYGNIDHIVIARHGGVFLIETKSHNGTVDVIHERLLLNREPMIGDPIQQTLRNSMWLKEKMGEILGKEPYITAVLLFTNAYVKARQPVRGVIISSQRFLYNVLFSSPNSTAQRDLIWSHRADIKEMLSKPSDKSLLNTSME